MQIVADENIPLLAEFFAAFGDIRRYPGRAIDRAALGDAEVLLVRSVTRVDERLLAPRHTESAQPDRVVHPRESRLEAGPQG